MPPHTANKRQNFFYNICTSQEYSLPLYHIRMETIEHTPSDDVDTHQKNADTYYYMHDIGHLISFSCIYKSQFLILRL